MERTRNMRVALYARVSTTRQDCQPQLDELREYAGRRCWEVVGEYVDHGVSGSRDSRPELNKLMADAKRRRFDAIAVTKLDRFGRSLRHLVNGLADLESLGVAFISLGDNIDLSTPSGRLMFAVISAMAQFERELIRERVIGGQQRAMAKGVKFGRPRLKIDATRVRALRQAGVPWRKMAKQLGTTVPTLYARLRAS